ncbi:LLM class F420-dependent oxidoreductase [Mycobacterium antarcticum]|nr:LLM class F420-dependent oxidoreductase [Mycolicibacterium sp. TUM20985]GLP75563.1 LLM class F420-dependent oxidoreductase [Mycolicibacterium sp. TUM20983]GLP84163.1 LLM class F420-dependent oxidoreductase [Mycolicibacterium sp. TUM20984]
MSAGPTRRTEFFLRSYPIVDGMQEHAAAVECDGWDGLLFTDTQNLSMDVFASLYLAAGATSHLRLGTAVTNLTSRHPAVVASAFATLQHVTGGRAHLGIGRGDSALELIGVKPPSASQFEGQLLQLQNYLRGAPVSLGDFESRITWLPLADEPKVPVDVFCSGPLVTSVGARLGDRVTLTVGADAERVRRSMQAIRQVRHDAGLESEDFDVGAFVVVGAGTDRRAIEEIVRGNASVSAHFQRNVVSSMPAAEAAAVEEVTNRYDYYHHGLEHAEQSESLTADFLSQFCIVGTPDYCAERLRGLIDIGLSHVVIVGGSRDIDPATRERSDQLIAREVLPAVKSTSA